MNIRFHFPKISPFLGIMIISAKQKRCPISKQFCPSEPPSQVSSLFANINASLRHYKRIEAFKTSIVAFIILWGQLIKVGNKDF